jgi:hypothetical protein
LSRSPARPTGRPSAAAAASDWLDDDDDDASWHFPSLWRVVRDDGTAVWDPAVGGGGKGPEAVEAPGSGDGAGGVSRVLSPGTVVLCTGVSVDDRDQAFLRVPGGWIPREDAVKVADVRA